MKSMQGRRGGTAGRPGGRRVEAVTHEQGGLEAGTRAAVGVGVPWDAHSPLPKDQSARKGGVPR